MDSPLAVTSAELVSSISSIGMEIQRSFRPVIEAVGNGQPVRPQRLVTELKLNKDLASRLLVALDASDPLAMIHSLPGPVPLRTFIDACVRRHVSADLVGPARQAVDAFDGFLRENFDERGELDALLGSSLRDARLRAESAAKQAIFRGTVGLKGVMCEASFLGCLVHPSTDSPGVYDLVTVGGMAGLRRLRPDALVEYTSVRTQSTDPGLGAAGGSEEPLMAEFCHPHRLPVETIRENGEIRYRLTGDGVGRRAQTDLFFTHFTPGHFREDVAEGQPARRGMFAMVEQPTKRLVFDMFLHREVWPGRPLQLAIYDTAVHGLCNPNNPKHAQRRLDIAESIEELGFGLTRARHAHLPRYLEALEHVAAARGWQPSAFRGYRCEILYPMYGSQVCMGSVLEHRTDS